MSIVFRIMKTPSSPVIRFLISGLLTVFTCVVSNGQNISELRKILQDRDEPFFSTDQKVNLFSTADFHQYTRNRDDEFGEYLKEPWSDYAIIPGLSDEPRSNLSNQPVFNYSGVDISPPENLPFSSVVGFRNSRAGEVRLMPRIRKPESELFTPVKGTFLFYGQPIGIIYDKMLTVAKITSVSENSVSEFWSSFALSNSNNLVDQLMDYRDLLGLGDWGYFQLVKAASAYLFSEDPRNADLMTWALMIRSGFDVRLAFNQDTTVVLFPSLYIIYARQFVVIGQQRFYLDREMNDQLLVTYEQPFRDTERSIDLRFYKSLNFSGKLTVRKFYYLWKNKNFEFSLRTNPEVVRFFRNYPQTEPAVYFGAPLSSTLKEDLCGQFYPLFSEMDRAEAIVFLQQFVQKKFYYTSVAQKDVWANGRFAEEVVASKSGDDRAKAVLFSWLVRTLTRLPVVGVRFPNYYSTAISFGEPFEGDYYFLNRQKYCLTDPTYLNAPVGVMMPDLAGLTPQLIDLSVSVEQPGRAEDTWRQAVKLGAMHGGTGQDAVFDRQGRALIAGYFSNRQFYTPFIASFSPGNSLRWIRKFEGDGKAIAFAITKVHDNEIYIAGSFSGKIVMDGAELKTGTRSSDLFLAQFNRNGELIWLKNAGIDSSALDPSLAYLVKFDRSGGNILVQWSNEDIRNIKNGFGNVSETGLCFMGSKSVTPGLVPFSWSTVKSDISGEIFGESVFLKDKGCNPKMAGFAALLKLLQKPGAEVTGAQLQSLVIRYKSSFSSGQDDVVKKLGQIGRLSNENGIILLRTNDNKAIALNNLRIADEARFTIAVLGNGDFSVNIISGFQSVAKEREWPLNNLLIDCSSGNVILDYDHDHTLKTVFIETLFSSK